MTSGLPKTLAAKHVEVSRSMLYYKRKKPDKDWLLKQKIEEVLREHPSYGSRRVSIHLKLNRKGVQRVMKLYGIKAYRRRGKKYKSTKNIKVIYPNLLLTTIPSYPNHIWVSDFTYLAFQGKTVYVATVMDIFTRKIVGISVYTTHATELVLSAFMNALLVYGRPSIFHSDNGSEYNSDIFKEALLTVGTQISRSAPGCPWENGYQESFYSQFKVDLGDWTRYKTIGELVFAVYQTIWDYNNTRIHSALKMSPVQFALQLAKGYTT
jgi:putative transposase